METLHMIILRARFWFAQEIRARTQHTSEQVYKVDPAVVYLRYGAKEGQWNAQTIDDANVKFSFKNPRTNAQDSHVV